MRDGDDNSREVLLRIAHRVRELRTRRNLTQEAAADGAGLALRHFQKVEAGEVNVTVRTLARIAQTLDVDVCELLRRDEAGAEVQST